jgi:hypothetical protein
MGMVVYACNLSCAGVIDSQITVPSYLAKSLRAYLKNNLGKQKELEAWHKW